jgi:hypothetical protein
VAIDPANGDIIVCDTGNNRILRVPVKDRTGF